VNAGCNLERPSVIMCSRWSACSAIGWLAEFVGVVRRMTIDCWVLGKGRFWSTVWRELLRGKAVTGYVGCPHIIFN